MDPRRLLPVLAATTAVVVVATLVALGWRTWSSGGDPDSDPGSAVASHVRAAPAKRPGPGSSAAAVLAAWDGRRARAWAESDAEALRQLYAEGSRAGRTDVALLRRYARRGLRVTGLQTQLLDLDVVAERTGRLHVVVTDRVVGGEAVGAGRTVTLPRDRPSTRRIVLVRRAGSWVVALVRDVSRAPGQPRAATSTSRTSRSSKS